ncbi:protein madd-4-like isoform X3 [Penaeus monodon]|uniref:protein madd-4-like isoform X3 n=1 Tax=Penaeus monodon TaxID=6687 RepID=UPI0018A7406B|nr:protein madd-4-like isoform X3 [Penaeus monodon]
MPLFFLPQVVLGQGAVLVDDALPEDSPTLTEDSEEGWSEWSEWSPCSRTCDGGAAVQSRRCLHYAGCRGDSVRYQLCNLDPCPAGSRDFRAVQCSEYDGLPHEGNMYEWEPAEGEDLCALTCRARGGGPVVTLNPRVQDGTRCTKDSLDLCINGRCQKVGCDLRLGSKKTVDACGVCGGDGSTCNKPSYYWDKRPTGPCSATCGGGYQMLSGVCVEQGTGRRVAEDLCDHAARPIPVILNCNDDACPTSWQTGEWGSCSVSCGSGYQLREVYCAEPRNTSVVRVADHYCTSPRPPHRQPCNTHDCPRWYDGIWSQCSATCGDGVQTRVVLCRDARGRSSRHCDPAHRPSNTRSCRTGITCPPPTTLAHPRHQPYTPAWWTEEQDLASEEGVAPLMPRPQALTADQQVPAEPTYITGNWSDCSAKCGEGVRTRTVTCKIFLEFSRTVAVLPDDQCPGGKPAQTEPCAMPCSHAMTRHDYPVGEVSDAAQDPSIASLEDAHEGINTADDHMAHETPYLPKLVDEDAPPRGSKTAGHDSDISVPQAQAYNEPRPGLHSFETPGDTRPPSDPLLLYAGEANERDQFESYEMTREKPHHVAEHSEMNSIEIDMGGGEGNFQGSYHVSENSNAAQIYEWFSSGFTPCSASCLGGVQESVIHCVRTLDKKIVLPQLCKVEERPDVITRTCNDQPCPPRWNVSEFGTCSKQCGGGVQTREVKCIHEVTRGGQNTIVVQDSLCPQPPQRTQQYCNIIDCQPQWVHSRWSKCSAPCGGGIKTREMKCQQTMALGSVVTRSDSECPQRKPPTLRKCNRRACQGERDDSDRPIIYAQNYQNYNQSKYMRKVTLKVGGRAKVFRGVMVKVKCPVRRFDRSKITWWFDDCEIGRSGATRTTNKGVLKIKEAQYPDAGVYICKADKSEANLTLEVVPLPSSYSPVPERDRGSLENEVSLHTHEDTGFGRHDYDWPRNKFGKKKGRNGRRRQSSRGNRRRKNKAKSSHATETTLRPIEPFPSGPESDTLGEGPFKASSKNIHTVEVTSGEATNIFDLNRWRGNDNSRKSDDKYVYGTITHHAHNGWDRERENHFGITNHLSERKETSSERPHVYGKITHHSDGSRITSEESHHIFGTILHGPPDNALIDADRTEWPGFSSSTEMYYNGKNRQYDGDVNNAIEDDLTALGKKLNLSPDDSDSVQQHRHQSLSRSGQRSGSRNGHTSSGLWRGHSSVPLSGHSETLGSDHSESQLSGHASSSHSRFSSTGTTTTTTTTTSNSPSSWNSWENTPDQNNHWSVDDPPIPPPAPPNTSSGGSRSMPYFQKLLSNLESFLPASLQRSIGSRGGRHVSSGDVDGMMPYDIAHDATTTEHPMGTPEILGKGTRDSLEFEWQMTNWSACSQTCGFSSTSTGYQVRSIQCLVRVDNVSRAVDGALCADAGLEAPVTIQKCGLTECPHWNFDEWSPCETSRCFTLHYAFQRRDVVCQLHNATIVSNDQCDLRTKPRHRRECYNKQCTGVWKVGEWSECTAPCGGQGYRTRLLQCVWNGTKRAAGNACRELPRPEVVRWCDGPPCPVSSM